MAKWTLDPAHAEVGFKVKHLMINNVKGTFKTFTVDVETAADDFKDAKIHFTADIASINTGNEQRDGHLKGADFFDAEKHPQIIFEATHYAGDKLEGNLTIASTTKPVTLHVIFGGITKDPWGNTKAGFEVTGKINRKDFGIGWNAPLETGGVVVGEEVTITAEIELAKQA